MPDKIVPDKDKKSRPSPKRQYPPFYEKVVPIALGVIAIGAMLPAFGGAFSRFGISGALYWTELLGAILILIGFIRATTPMKKESDE